MPQMYLTIRELDRSNGPAMCLRRGERVIVAWDPRALRIEITGRLLDILDRPEQEALCKGLGISFPLPDWTVAERPAFLYVPQSLRVPGRPAFQGGGELVRRQSLGQLDLERAAFRAEILGHAVDLQAVDDLVPA